MCLACIRSISIPISKEKKNKRSTSALILHSGFRGARYLKDGIIGFKRKEGKQKASKKSALSPFLTLHICPR